MDTKTIIVHWIESAQEDKQTAESLFASGHYHWCLFLWHLVLEKLFKAKITSQEREVPFTHNLVLLASESSILYSDQEKEELQEITTFNLEARYDDYKQEFYKKATKEYATTQIAICKRWEEKIRRAL